MHRTDAIAWVVSVCAVPLRLSQAKTLAILVAAAMRVQRVPGVQRHRQGAQGRGLPCRRGGDAERRRPLGAGPAAQTRRVLVR
jgi:hypothetical protein